MGGIEKVDKKVGGDEGREAGEGLRKGGGGRIG